MCTEFRTGGRRKFSNIARALATALAITFDACGNGSKSSAAPTSPSPTSTASKNVAPPVMSTGPANINGNYTLTMRSAPSCPALTVTWQMTFLQNGVAIGLVDNDRTPLSAQNYSLTMGGMLGTVNGTTVTVNIDMIYSLKTSDEYPWRVSGRFTGTAAGNTITGNLNGIFGKGLGGCTAANHPMTFTR
jgi:hypothetical protein